ncbi:MAG: cbb3-type cytochrome oxidase assembly protein CcoS [Saprospiraceae bacterium]|nr:cbb3-type cytochrome oxidase assembly protein CcoS [Saprospiraceae bacterium]
MGIIFYLIVISLCMAVFFLIAFFWAVKDGQYDDEYTPGMRILVDDDMIDRGENIHSTN